ncbi:nickel pincer cofactor biosynthesis protein LarB [Actinopolymorpha pittospori]|uniref:NCAIR mutase (PurE)-related protein n=1 Tax=Actinopolymorpha pittospori TaxID=648752 RepID=A0A927R8A9_9ACTN|nr:nickel pincer cofactor biosynthesis protein LarB [Actinopolymorpha pittospori]MBE1605164.1 NCAIR mutase (PurE)-related protein [Actinopolymorpha pittospori]
MTSSDNAPSGRQPEPAGQNGAGHGYVDLGYARLDTDRLSRTGDPEVVYGAGKTPDQVVDLLRHLHTAHPDRAALATRLDSTALAMVREAFPQARIDEVAGAATLGPLPAPAGLVCVLAAGTSDARVAREAVCTVEAFGAGVRTITDVGVAGVHRLLAAKEEFDDADCLIVVAGMEGALPSVVGGLTGVPLVAVPTSVGYGASFGGLAALLGMLNSCAPGVVVSNIDNGFGAGVFAARVARRAARPRADQPTPDQSYDQTQDQAPGQTRDSANGAAR